MYKVIKFFTDLHDNNHPYNVGDIYPRKDVKVTESRIAELAGSNNKQGEPLIVKVEVKAETPAPKKTAAKKPVNKTANK